ncbi:hypothetical protein [Streptomyces sedi]|uniref:Uncharacterized protein n=1 Tax=Streptomyces sedi TaxID=555059 RepID=A0A5C4V448_9ACTN|nr:hypothetical protein [Streptomyces sedi]TNM30587.1 hypothetical protein FH715_11310 [Streptomyces sedi]
MSPRPTAARRDEPAPTVPEAARPSPRLAPAWPGWSTLALLRTILTLDDRLINGKPPTPRPLPRVPRRDHATLRDTDRSSTEGC